MKTTWTFLNTYTLITLGHLAIPLMASAVEPFQEAKRFTVRVKTSIAIPFKEDNQGSATGTAFLVDTKRGWLLTNAHVSGRSPADMKIAWEGSDEISARLVYADRLIDLAIIGIDPKVVPSTARNAPLDCTNEPKVGMAVGAYGHPRREYFRGSRGIVAGLTSNLSDFIGEFIHIDTPINPGNSGGPILDLETGKVIGIATAGTSNAQGMNYALQIYQACKIIALLQKGVDPSPPRLDVSWIRSTEEPKDLRVARVFATGEASGRPYPLQEGDQIVHVEGGEVPVLRSWSQLAHELRGRQGDARLVVRRRNLTAITIEVPIHPEPLVTERTGFFFSGLNITGSNLGTFLEIGTERPHAVIVHVSRGSTGESAEFEAGDQIISLNGKALTSLADFRSRIEGASQNEQITLQIRRIDFFQGRLFGDFIKHIQVSDRHVVSFQEEGAPVRKLANEESGGEQ